METTAKPDCLLPGLRRGRSFYGIMIIWEMGTARLPLYRTTGFLLPVLWTGKAIFSLSRSMENLSGTASTATNGLKTIPERARRPWSTMGECI